MYITHILDFSKISTFQPASVEIQHISAKPFGCFIGEGESFKNASIDTNYMFGNTVVRMVVEPAESVFFIGNQERLFIISPRKD